MNDEFLKNELEGGKELNAKQFQLLTLSALMYLVSEANDRYLDEFREVLVMKSNAELNEKQADVLENTQTLLQVKLQGGANLIGSISDGVAQLAPELAKKNRELMEKLFNEEGRKPIDLEGIETDDKDDDDIFSQLSDQL